MARVGDRLRELREAAGLSQRELADLISVRDATVSRYETGKAQLKADDLYRVAGALGVHPAEFYVELPAEAAPEEERPEAVARYVAEMRAQWDALPEAERSLLTELDGWMREQLRLYRQRLREEWSVEPS